jgi:bile acid-coenzyme A ligase
MSGPMSIGRVFGHFAERTPDRVAVLEDGSGEAYTWAELDRAANQLARTYAASGVAQGDIVAVVLPNSAAFYLACVAIWKLGATPMPLSVRQVQAERDRILDLAKPSLVITSLDPPTGDDSPLPDVSPTYWKVLTSGGSTGQPKLIVARDDPHFDPDVAPVEYIPAGGVHLAAGPLYHNAAFIYSMRGLFCGNQVVVMPRFDAARALELIDQHQVSWTQLVPTMMNRIWHLPEEVRTAASLASLRTVLHVGGPCAPWLKEAWINWLGPDRIVEVYAGTEGQGVTFISGREWLQHRGSVGRPIRGSRFEVQDENGAIVPPGVVGEVFLMPEDGPGSTYHYIGAEPRSRDGWESLGDLGYYDEDGYLYLVDRSTDCIVTGGANVYPAEVEAALHAYPGVRASAVIGLPDDDLGQRVVALIEADDGVTAEALDAHLQAELTSYKRPRAYEFVTEPLRDEAGKVRRTALRNARLPSAAS